MERLLTNKELEEIGVQKREEYYASIKDVSAVFGKKLLY